MYKTNFLLFNEHRFMLADIEEMVPYEKEIYVALLLSHLEEKKKLKNQQH